MSQPSRARRIERRSSTSASTTSTSRPASAAIRRRSRTVTRTSSPRSTRRAATCAPRKPVAPGDADSHRLRKSRISMARTLLLTDTSPSDGVFDTCRPCTIDRLPGIVAEPRYFGLLTALAAVFVCLAAASPAAAAPHVPGELLVKYRAGATAAARAEARAAAGVRAATPVDARTERVTVGGGTVRAAARGARARGQRGPRRAQLRRHRDRLRTQRPGQGRARGLVGAAVELHGPVRDQRGRRLGQRDRRRQRRAVAG